MIAHTLGNPFDLEKIKNLCDKYNLYLIEDCCDALGSKYQNKHVGTFGDVGTLSFYPAHHITMGEGGAVLQTHQKLKDLWNQSGIGEETAGVKLVVIIHVKKDLNGNFIIYHMDMIINMFILL